MLRCRSRLVDSPRLYDPAPVVPFRPSTSVSYDAAFERSLSVVARRVHLLERERGEAPGLFAELMERTEEQREILLRNSRRFRTWGLLELAVERSLERSIQDAERGEELGRLALRISDLLDDARYGADQLEDLRARAWAYVGNARRIRSDFQGAEEAFRQALSHLQRGTGDLFEQAILLDLQASLRRSQRRFDNRAQARAQSDRPLPGASERASCGPVAGEPVDWSSSTRDEPRRASPVLYRAQDLIDPRQEPRLLLSARHNLILC